MLTIIRSYCPLGNYFACNEESFDRVEEYYETNYIP